MIMKTFLKCTFSVAMIALVFFSCNKEDDIPKGISASSMPTSLNFLPVYTMYEWSGVQISEPGVYNLVWEGNGSEPRLGKFSVKLTFTCDLISGCIGQSNGCFELETGDKLYFILVDGLITDCPDDMSGYHHKSLNNKALIRGGTGLLENASGSFYTDGLILIESSYWKAECQSKGSISFERAIKPAGNNQLPDFPIASESHN
jgi:hypothetical protein